MPFSARMIFVAVLIFVFVSSLVYFIVPEDTAIIAQPGQQVDTPDLDRPGVLVSPMPTLLALFLFFLVLFSLVVTVAAWWSNTRRAADAREQVASELRRERQIGEHLRLQQVDARLRLQQIDARLRVVEKLQPILDELYVAAAADETSEAEISRMLRVSRARIRSVTGPWPHDTTSAFQHFREVVTRRGNGNEVVGEEYKAMIDVAFERFVDRLLKDIEMDIQTPPRTSML